MKRRQFSALVATATFSLAGAPGISGAAADEAAQETDPLKVSDVTIEAGGITSSIGRAMLSFEDDTLTFQVQDWAMEGRGRTLSVKRKQIVVKGIDAETYATIRNSMVESVSGRSPSPLLSAFVEADIDEDADFRMRVGPITLDEATVADRVTATGTVGGITPDGSKSLAEEGISLQGIAGLGSSEFDRVVVQRKNARLAANDVTMQLEGTTLAISSPGGKITLPGRSLKFQDMTMDVLPPETIPAAHVEFLSRVRQLVSEDSASLSEVRSAASESGVTVSNTADAASEARFQTTFGEVTEDSETLVADLQTDGTLAELFQVLRQRL